MRRSSQSVVQPVDRSGFDFSYWLGAASGYVLVAFAVAFLPALGPNRLMVALTVGIVGPIASFLIERTGPGNRKDAYYLALVVLMIFALVPLAPQAFYGACVLLAMIVITAVLQPGIKVAYFVAVCGVSGLALIAYLNDVPNWPSAILAFAAFVPISFGQNVFRRRLQVDERRLRTVMASSNAVFFESDGNGNVEVLSTSSANEAGHTLGKEAAARLIHSSDRVVLPRRPDQTVSTDVRVRTNDGSWGWFRFVITSDEVDQRVLRGVAFDISELQTTQLELHRYEDVVDRLHDAVIVARLNEVQSNFLIEIANPAVAAVLGLEPEALAGRALTDVLPWVADSALLTAAHGVATDGVPRELDRVSASTPKGTRVVDVDLARMPDDSVSLTFNDVSSQVEAEQVIRHQAEHDSLTGLVNRSVLLDAMSTRLNTGRRRPDPFALLLIDLDRFKQINDTLGHHFGDRLLQRLSARIATAARSQDIVARLGGDEFAVLIDRPGSIEDIVEIAERIGHLCGRSVEIDQLSVAVSASIGIALAPEHGHKPSTLMRRADSAMYDAKRSSRQVAVFDPINETLDVEQIMLSSDIDRAIQQEEFQLWAQPKVCLETGEIIGAEGLVRWHHPALGVLRPDRFLDLLDVAGRLGDLARIVLDQGIRAAANIDAADDRFHIAINLAARDLADESLVQLISSLLERYDVAPSRIALEITESHLMEEFAVTQSVLEELGKLGVALSIDDFGTGYSSLARLRALPVAEVKIDRSFINELRRDATDTIIVRSIVDLAHNLGMDVTAEGVEDVGTCALLRTLGCDAAQGFLWGTPEPIDSAVQRIGTAVPSDAKPDSGVIGLPRRAHPKVASVESRRLR